jgi:hypothetical protein
LDHGAGVTRTEALSLLEEELGKLRRESYNDLVGRIKTGALTETRQGDSGTEYQLEFTFTWDDRPGGNVRVLGSIDDGRWRAFVPITRSFIKSPDNTFVDEHQALVP